jgi:outer membrane immunogenic protein
MWNQDNQAFIAGVPVSAEHTDGGRGWLGRVGRRFADYHFRQKFVVGALADYDFASLRATYRLWGLLAAIAAYEKMTWAWAGGGRLGYLPWDTLMVYMSGGYTQAHFNGTALTPVAFTTSGTYVLRLVSGQRLRIQIRYAAWFVLEDRISLQQLQQQRHPNFGGAPNTFVNSEKFVQTVTSSLVWRFSWWR